MIEAKTEAVSPLIPPTPARSEKLAWLGWGGLAGMWLLLLDQLRLEWSINDDYSYGFIVPLLAAYLFAQRWQSRPAASLLSEPSIPAGLMPLLGIFVFCLLPVRLVQVAAPEWLFVNWALAGIVVSTTLGCAWLRWGKKGAWHLAFPIAFIISAVPWPTFLEVPLTQFLMRADTAFSVFLLNWTGIPAVQAGNLIRVGSDTVGVSEACSGIRSLQVTWMSAWFLGELYRFHWVRRFLLVGLGVGIALLCNLGRTCLLAWLSVRHGPDVMEKWHDSVGLAVLAIALGALWGLSAWRNPAASQAGAVTAAPEGGPARVNTARPWPQWFTICLACWLLFVIGGTEAWYRWHETGRPGAFSWRVLWPEGAPGFKQIPIPDRSRWILKYNEGSNVTWAANNGGEWTGFFFRWAPGRTSKALAHAHRPEGCLTAIGCRLERDLGTETFSVNGLALPFRHFLFSKEGRSFYVWWCLWDESGNHNDGGASTYEKATRAASYRNILTDVALGHRNFGQQVLEIVLSGANDSEAAHDEMARMFPQLIVQQRN